MINEAYKPLYTTDKRFILITGGRGSGKSYAVHDWIVRLTYEQGHGVLFTRYTMTSAETSIIPEFKAAIERLGVEEDFHVTSKDIYNLRTGSYIWFRGIKASSNSQKANMKSLSGITTFIVEEGEDFQDERAFDTIDDSIRTTEKQNRVIWIQNPSTREHFIYKRWIEGHQKTVKIQGYDVTVSNHPDVEHIHTTYLMNEENLTASWLKKAYNNRKNNLKWYINNYLGGWLEKAEGVIFTNWSIGEFNDSLPFGFGKDFGYSNDPTTLIKVAIDEDNHKIYAKELIYEPHLKTSGIVLKLQKYCSKDDLIIADCAEPRLIDEIYDEGYNIQRCIKGADSIRAGIRLIQDYELIVDPNSINLKKELNNYIWNDKRSGKPIDDHNHLLDALRYYVSYIETKPEFFVI